MNFNDYQLAARKTMVYPTKDAVVYPTLGLTGEAGEVAEKVKKAIRDGHGALTVRSQDIAKELGDVLWYVANLAMDLGLDLDTIAELNLAKLKSRQDRGKLHGDGDDR